MTDLPIGIFKVLVRVSPFCQALLISENRISQHNSLPLGSFLNDIERSWCAHTEGLMKPNQIGSRQRLQGTAPRRQASLRSFHISQVEVALVAMRIPKEALVIKDNVQARCLHVAESHCAM